MKNLFIISALAATMTTGLVQAEITREIRQVRVDAVNTLSHNLPCKFINQKTLLDALNFIDKELDPKTHQELLKLQAEADALHQQRVAMLAIPGIDATHPAVVYVDEQLVLVEKALDNLLYNGGFFHWKTMSAVAAGAVYGAYGYNKGAFFVRKDSVMDSLLVGLAVAVLLEWSIRGRRAVLAGNFASLAKFVSSVAVKFFGHVFGDGGYCDRMIATVERALRSVGKKLDAVLDNKWVVGGIGSVAALAVGGMFYYWGRRDGAAAVLAAGTQTTEPATVEKGAAVEAPVSSVTATAQPQS